MRQRAPIRALLPRPLTQAPSHSSPNSASHPASKNASPDFKQEMESSSQQTPSGPRVKRKTTAAKTKTLPCPHCQRLFARLEHLQRHVRTRMPFSPWDHLTEPSIDTSLAPQTLRRSLSPATSAPNRSLEAISSSDMNVSSIQARTATVAHRSRTADRRPHPRTRWTSMLHQPAP